MQSPDRGSALLTQAVLFAALVALSTCMTVSTGSHLCPRSLDCARAGRHFCQPGTSQCGPCLDPLVENSHGRCVVTKRRRGPQLEVTYPELDEEIDFLSTIISQQHQKTGINHSAPSSQDVLKLKEEELKLQGPAHRPTTEPPATPGASSAPPNATGRPTSRGPGPEVRNGPLITPYPADKRTFLIMSSVFAVVGSLTLLLAAVCWIRLQKGTHLTQKVDYPAYGGMGPPSYAKNPGDKRLAHSAQMYHYQHQKQQMLSLEKHRDEPKVSDSGATSDEENEDGDFTVYECPGLAPTGEMEVKNPLFDDSTLYLQRTHK